MRHFFFWCVFFWYVVSAYRTIQDTIIILFQYQIERSHEIESMLEFHSYLYLLDKLIEMSENNSTNDSSHRLRRRRNLRSEVEYYPPPPNVLTTYRVSPKLVHLRNTLSKHLSRYEKARIHSKYHEIKKMNENPGPWMLDEAYEERITGIAKTIGLENDNIDEIIFKYGQRDLLEIVNDNTNSDNYISNQTQQQTEKTEENDKQTNNNSDTMDNNNDFIKNYSIRSDELDIDPIKNVWLWHEIMDNFGVCFIFLVYFFFFFCFFSMRLSHVVSRGHAETKSNVIEGMTLGSICRLSCVPQA